jgi:hypothetical protein
MIFSFVLTGDCNKVVGHFVFLIEMPFDQKRKKYAAGAKRNVMAIWMILINVAPISPDEKSIPVLVNKYAKITSWIPTPFGVKAKTLTMEMNILMKIDEEKAMCCPRTMNAKKKTVAPAIN